MAYEHEILPDEENPLPDEVDDPALVSNTASCPVTAADMQAFLNIEEIMAPPLEEAQVLEVQAVFDPGVETESEKCPQCGGGMKADVDPMSLLSFPMKYIWRCDACGHEESRKDRHVENNPGADASLVIAERDLF